MPRKPLQSLSTRTDLERATIDVGNAGCIYAKRLRCPVRARVAAEPAVTRNGPSKQRRVAVFESFVFDACDPVCEATWRLGGESGRTAMAAVEHDAARLNAQQPTPGVLESALRMLVKRAFKHVQKRAPLMLKRLRGTP